ncbi:uncharacterized protein LOC142599550 [Balearica regulorum gibbericeps]|uniref:uncharacterized protein LOC142599550 n=1 Tax=Balearica regulorum gibbericeps TaxID=100784 RepID=UPI003F646746
MESMATELEDRCPICLGSWEEPSFVMPCLHRFCYPCILRWAERKPECPLCKRGIRSIFHSVRADDDYVEHVVTPPVTPPAVVRQAGGAPRHPAAHHLHHPGAPHRWAAEGLPRHPVGGLQTPNWMSGLRNNSTLIQILQPLVQREQERMFATLMGTPNNRRLERELLGRMRGVSHQNRTAPLVRQRTCVAVQGRSGEAHRHLGRQDACAAGGREGSPAGAPGPAASQGGFLTPSPAPSGSPLRPSTEELPSTSSAAGGGSPSSQPSAPVAIPAEQEEPQEEPGQAVPGPSTSSRGSEGSPEGPRRPPKRRAGRSDTSPANKRPAPRR